MSNYSDSEFDSDENSSWQKTFALVPEKSTVLDIGCSNGVFGRRLIQEKRCVVDGIEINKGDIREAKKVLREVYDINVEQQPINNITNRYDVIFMGDVVEHLANPKKTLAKIRTLLKPNGIFIFSIPNITHMSVRLMLMSGKIEYGRTGLLDETHLHFYNSKEIKRIMNAAGFSLISLDHTTNDLPQDVLREELGKLGLEPKPEFRKVSQSTDAIAYQFIGVAKLGDVVYERLPKSSPTNIVDAYHRRLKKDYEMSVKAIRQDRKNLEEEIERLRKENLEYAKMLSVRISRYARNKIKKSDKKGNK